MNGLVDDYGRPIVRLAVKHPFSTASAEFEALIDTGFNRALVLTADQVATLGLSVQGTVDAQLADGSCAALSTYFCKVAWFGGDRTIDAILCSGRFALIGVGLLEDLIVYIDYPARTVELSLSLSR